MTQFGVSQKDVVETTLADLSVQQVSERLPALFNHYLGFELIEKNDEGTRAAGLLGFDIGSKIFYVPSLFLNGRIKGTEMIYCKDSDLFVPGTKQWVDELINNSQAIIGEAANYSPRGQVGVGQLQIFRAPQLGSGGKAAALGENGSGVALMDLLQKEYDATALSVTRFLKMAGYDTYRRFMKYAMHQRPSLMRALCNVYHPDDLKIAEFEQLEAEETAASMLKAPPVQDSPTLKVIIDPTDEAAKSLDLTEKTKLMSTGIAIVDTRKNDEKPIELSTQESEQFENPDRTGVYEMLGKDLEFNKVVISVKPSPVEVLNWHAPGYVIVDPSSGYCNYETGKAVGNVPRVAPIVKDVDKNSTEITSFASGVSSLSSVSVGKTYVLIRKDKPSMSLPFRVLNKTGGKFRAETADDLLWKINSWRNNFPLPVPAALRKQMDYETSSSTSPVRDTGVWIEEFSGDGSEPYVTDSRVFLPKGSFGVKEVTVVDSACEGGLCPGLGWGPDDYPKTEAAREARRVMMERKEQTHKKNVMKVCPSYQGEVNVAILAANRGTLKSASFITKDELPTQALRVQRDMGDYKITFNGKTAAVRGKVNLIATLVKNVNLGEDDARKIAERAERFEKVATAFAFPKTARPIPNAAIDIPWPDIDDSAGSTPYSGTPEVTSVQGIVQGDHEVDQPEDPFNPEIADYNQIMQKALGDQESFVERAGQSGIKQVFDPAMIGILLKTNRVQLQVESEFLPALIRGVDRMCRLLLTFYWHNAEFAENYGQDKLAEFEDVLLSTIKDAGQCVLFLKQKAVGGKNLDAFTETA